MQTAVGEGSSDNNVTSEKVNDHDQRRESMHSTTRTSERYIDETLAQEQPVNRKNHARAFSTDQVVHEIVTILQTHYHRVMQYADPDASPLPLLLQSGPLYTDIASLIQLANGELPWSPTSDKEIQAVGAMVQRIIDLLFLPPGGVHAAPIPSTFWTSTATGKLLVQVLSLMQRDDLVSSLVTRSLQGEMRVYSGPVPTGELEQRGKSIPVPFIKGLMGAIIDIFGYGAGAPDLLRLSVDDKLPPMQHWQDWLWLVATFNPLCAYYRSDLGTPEPIDYRFLERLRQAIVTLYPQGHAFLSQRIGWSWWVNDYPLARRWYSSYSMQHLLGPVIVQTLQQTTVPPPPDDHAGIARFVWTEEQRVRLACRQFVQALQSDGGISCTIVEHERALLIWFTDCPFCANRLPECGILFGLVERMILWLYGERHVDKVSRTHSVCAEITNGLLSVRTVRDDSHAVAIVFAVAPSPENSHSDSRGNHHPV